MPRGYLLLTILSLCLSGFSIPSIAEISSTSDSYVANQLEQLETLATGAHSTNDAVAKNYRDQLNTPVFQGDLKNAMEQATVNLYLRLNEMTKKAGVLYGPKEMEQDRINLKKALVNYEKAKQLFQKDYVNSEDFKEDHLKALHQIKDRDGSRVSIKAYQLKGAKAWTYELSAWGPGGRMGKVELTKAGFKLLSDLGLSVNSAYSDTTIGDKGEKGSFIAYDLKDTASSSPPLEDHAVRAAVSESKALDEISRGADPYSLPRGVADDAAADDAAR